MEPRFKPKPSPEGEPSRPVSEEDQPLLTDLPDFLKRTQAVLPLVVIGLFVMATVSFLYFAKPFFLPVLLAIVFSFLLKPVVTTLHKLKIPEWIGSLIVIGAFFTIIYLLVAHLAEPAKEWASQAPENFRKVEQRIQKILAPAKQLSERVEKITESASAPTQQQRAPSQPPPPKVEVKKTDLAGTVVSYAGSFIAGLIGVIVLLYFLLSSGDLFTQKLVKVLPTWHDKKKALTIVHEVQENISVYLFTITCINTCLGALVGFAVMLVGMPNPLLWGVVAATLNFVPYFGPLTGVTLIAVAGLVSFDSVGRALLCPGIYLCLHAVESNFFTPLILGKRLTLNPVVIFTSLLFWMWLWGVPGALLAVPLLMMMKIVCDHFKPLAAIGEFLGEADGKMTDNGD